MTPNVAPETRGTPVGSGLSGIRQREAAGFVLVDKTQAAVERDARQVAVEVDCRGSLAAQVIEAALHEREPIAAGHPGSAVRETRSLRDRREVYSRLRRYSAIARRSSSGSLARFICTSAMPPLDSLS